MPDHPWPDDDLFPPLDIDRAAIAILQETGCIYDQAVRAAIEDMRNGDQPRPTIRMKAGDETRQAVIRVLTAYDTGRTEQIKFLKQELIRMHRLYPQPIVIALERKTE